jgi:hypothetical protein
MSSASRSFVIPPGSPCRHGGRTISSRSYSVSDVWPLRVPQLPLWPSLLIVRTGRIVTTEVVAPDTRMFQQIVEFIDSAVSSLSHACCSCITAGTDYVFTLFRGAGVLWEP